MHFYKLLRFIFQTMKVASQFNLIAVTDHIIQQNP